MLERVDEQPDAREPGEQPDRARLGQVARFVVDRHRCHRRRRWWRGASPGARGSRRPRSAARRGCPRTRSSPAPSGSGTGTRASGRGRTGTGSSTSFSRSLRPVDVRRRVAVHEQRLAPGLGVRDDDLVLDRRALLLHLGEIERRVPVADRLAAASLVMSWTATQAVDERTHRGRQRLVRRVHAREARVAADLRAAAPRAGSTPSAARRGTCCRCATRRRPRPSGWTWSSTTIVGRVLVHGLRAARRAAVRSAARTRAAARRRCAGRGRRARGGRAAPRRIAATVDVGERARAGRRRAPRRRSPRSPAGSRCRSHDPPPVRHPTALRRRSGRACRPPPWRRRPTGIVSRR